MLKYIELNDKLVKEICELFSRYAECYLGFDIKITYEKVLNKLAFNITISQEPKIQTNMIDSWSDFENNETAYLITTNYKFRFEDKYSSTVLVAFNLYLKFITLNTLNSIANDIKESIQKVLEVHCKSLKDE